MAHGNQYSNIKRGFKYYFRAGMIEVDYESSLVNGSHCWLWLGGQSPDGYGQVRYKGDKGWITLRAQKYFWHVYRRETSLDIAHQCHRRLCVNLRHLEEADRLDNLRQRHEDQHYGEEQRSQVRQLLAGGFTISYIADKMQAPRLYIARLSRELDWRNIGLFDAHDG